MRNNYYFEVLGDINGLDEELFERALDRWTERPLLSKGYSKKNLKLFDALIWTRVENDRSELQQIKNSINDRDKIRKNSSYCSRLLSPPSNDNLLMRLNNKNKEIESWKYTGKIYRVIDCMKGKVEYHQLIASWVKDPESFKNFNHIYKNKRYVFLTGDTNEDWAFDVNKYRDYIGNRHCYTEHESEIIFPMDKKYVVDIFYGTLKEFYKHIKTKN